MLVIVMESKKQVVKKSSRLAQIKCDEMHLKKSASEQRNPIHANKQEIKFNACDDVYRTHKDEGGMKGRGATP